MTFEWYDVVLLVVSVILIALSLLQGGKSQGASGAITGGGMNIFAKTKERGSELVITWLTFGFAILFFFFALLIKALKGIDTSSTTEAVKALFNLIK